MSAWKPEEMRALANRPKVGQIDIDNMRQALLYAARVIEAGNTLLEENRRLLAEVNALKRAHGVKACDGGGHRPSAPTAGVKEVDRG